MAYGIPQNNVKRVFLLLKVRIVSHRHYLKEKLSKGICLLGFFYFQAAYNIGGHTISADTMQSSILECRMSRPGQVDPRTHIYTHSETLKNALF